jgi:hypothetical protein
MGNLGGDAPAGVQEHIAHDISHGKRLEEDTCKYKTYSMLFQLMLVLYVARIMIPTMQTCSIVMFVSYNFFTVIKILKPKKLEPTLGCYNCRMICLFITGSWGHLMIYCRYLLCADFSWM